MGIRKVIAALTLGVVLIGGGALLPARDLQPAPASASPSRSTQTVEELEVRFAADPTDDVIAAKLGLAYLDAVGANADPRFYPRAEEALRTALAINPDSFEATFGMAALAAGRHDFHGGLSWSRKAIRLDPYNSDARGIQGDSLIELGRYEAAARAFQRMVDLKPGLPSFARISYLRELQGDIPGAVRAMRQAFDQAGSPGDAAFAASHLGDLYLNQQRITKAERWYLRGTEIDPSATQPLSGLAKIAAVHDDLDEAIELIVKVLEINEEPGNAFFLGDLYRASGDEQAAADAYALGRRLNAREARNGSDVMLEASLFAVDSGQPTQALRLARAEYGIRRSVHTADAYAWALYANGRYKKARELSQAALRLGTKSASFHLHAGMIALQLDDRKGAIGHLSTVLELDPVFSLQHRATAERILDCLEDACGRMHR